jgi:predicted AAA+ superfamily ATPase
MNAIVRDALVQDNPWLLNPSAWPPVARPQVYLERRQFDLVALQVGGLPTDRATLVVGPRQAGKSTWAWEMLRRGPPALYLDAERPTIRAWCRDAGAAVADLREVLRPGAIFIEEAQHLDEAGLFVKGLVDRALGLPILVTGSSSYHLLARTRESLAGRATRARLLPFCLDEVAPPDGTPVQQELVRDERFARHLVVGGYPTVWLSAAPAVELAGLLDAFVLRDASDLFRIARPDAFRAVLRLAARQVGSLVNYAEWASIAGVSAGTVRSYLDVMQEAHLLCVTPLFAGGKRAELASAQKVYFVDTGLRNRLLDDLSPWSERADRGPLLEAWVASELHKVLPFGTPLRYWRTRSGAEVDFVVSDGPGLVAIEVKASTGRPVLSRSARSFIDAYAPVSFAVAWLGTACRERVGTTEVDWVPAEGIAAWLAPRVGRPAPARQLPLPWG